MKMKEDMALKAAAMQNVFARGGDVKNKNLIEKEVKKIEDSGGIQNVPQVDKRTGMLNLGAQIDEQRKKFQQLESEREANKSAFALAMHAE